MSFFEAYNEFLAKMRRLRISNAVPIVFAYWIVTAVSAAGAPLKCSDVGAEPTRLLHIDFDALRETYVGQYLLYQLDKPEMHSNMMAFQSTFSFDLRRQLHGMTIYTARSTPNESVVITYADFEPAHLAKLISGGEAAFAVTNHQHVIYSWVDKNKNSGDLAGARKYAAILPGRLIAGNSLPSVVDALAVVDGRAPGFSPRKAAEEFDTPGTTNFMVASARNLDFIESDSTVAMLKMATGVKLTASESDNVLNATLTVDARDAQTAGQMGMVAQGLIMGLSLRPGNPWAKLAEGMTVQMETNGFQVDLSVSSQDVMAALKKYFQKKNPKKQHKQ